MVSHIHIAEELILTFGYAILKTVFTVLVIDAFLEWVRKYLVCLAKAGEATVSLGLLLSWIAKWVVLQGQNTEGGGDFFAIGCGTDAECIVISGLVVVHFLL